VEPKKTAEIKISLPEKCSLGAYVHCYLYDKSGYCVAAKQLALPVSVAKKPRATEAAKAAENAHFIFFEGEGFKYTFSKDLGTFVSLLKNGEEQLCAPIKITTARAPIDNERTIKSKWYWYNPKEDDDEWRAFKEEEDKYSDNVEIPFEVYWRHDTRDRFMFPTKGHNVRIYGDVVGGDNNYWRAGFNFRQYLPVWRKYGHVFQFGLRGETVDDFSGGLPIYDRLFLGGSKSIRGVDFREIAPRVYARENKRGRYVPWGGRTSWCLNMEYSVPVISIVRIAFFSDLGSVGEDEFDFATDWFCWSAGMGLRLDLESFPMRLDFAVPVVDPDEDVDEKVFSFSIGYDF
jgi:outer membrane protein assembly factor BamA